MVTALLFLAIHYLVCLLFFLLVQRPLFIFYNRRTNPDKLNSQEVKRIYQAGISTDFVGAAYLTAIPLLVVWAHSHIGFNLHLVLTVTECVIAFIMAIISLADAALYPFWRFKIDSSVFAYLRSLEGAFASVTAAYLIVALGALVIFWAAIAALLLWIVSITVVADPGYTAQGWWHLPTAICFILAGGAIFAAIRGLNHRPKTPTIAFYSVNMYYNHSALNPLYNMIYSFSVNDHPDDQFKFMDREECDAKVREMFPTSGVTQTKLLKTDRPNILFVIWESLCAHYIEPLEGKPGVMPYFNKCCDEGVLFTKVDAGSFRTDRALVCILGGYLGQPTMSVIRNTKKLPALPALPRALADAGYKTAAVHGGNLNIMHKIDYYIASGHQTVRGIDDFPEGQPRCAWGIHDGYMFDLVAREAIDLTNKGEQWFITLQTLSSHEPYKVPFNKFEHNISNAYAYADDGFGKMIETLKASPAWDNLLIVVVGDHGLNCTDEPLERNLYPHIPILLLGGAVKEPKRIDTLMSQTDLAATLLGQLNLPHDQFPFSRDVLADTYTHPFTFHTYNNGFFLRDREGYTDYDNVAMKAIVGDDPVRVMMGRMILQSLYDDLSRR